MCCFPHKLRFPSTKSENILTVSCLNVLFSKALSPLFIIKKLVMCSFLSCAHIYTEDGNRRLTI